ncbi:hypothetical protein EST38_g11406 [Candolleomyces aberdarensis]|uniref:Uncharacterized protein n=1 Tax=Candolleomyces aberdarensis TaxID=2316362 RepID=A0A4Q2D7N2_9AGAR|nr:hypothetical protein EST38_g11406 [Candolleomyces aberdarensis]
MEVDSDTMTDGRETPTPQRDPIPNDCFCCSDGPVCKVDIRAPPTAPKRDDVLLAKTQRAFRKQELAGFLLPPTPDEKEVITSLPADALSLYLDGFCIAAGKSERARQELEQARIRLEKAEERYMSVYYVTGKIMHCLRKGELDEQAVQAVKDWLRRYPKLYKGARKTDGDRMNA